MSAEPFWKESLVVCPGATTAVLPVSASGWFPGVATMDPSIPKPVHGKGREICPEQCRSGVGTDISTGVQVLVTPSQGTEFA